MRHHFHFAAVGLALAACSGNATSNNATPDSGAPDSALDGATQDADAAPPPDAADSGDAAVCPESLAKACDVQLGPGEFGISCIDTWQQVLTDTRYCGTTLVETQADCGAYRALTVTNVDVSDTYYYDAASGALVAVVTNGFAGGGLCAGGPANFMEPTCSAPHTLDPCAVDAGSE